MTAFTNTDRQAGHQAMEQKLTPFQRAARKFLSGRPAAPPTTPLGGLNAAADQTLRLVKILETCGGKVFGVHIVLRAPNSSRAGTVPIDPEQEHKALEELGQYCKWNFTIAGLLFAVEDADGRHCLGYPLDRTNEGRAAVQDAFNRQMSGEIKRTV
jgi:hypothetical protein